MRILTVMSDEHSFQMLHCTPNGENSPAYCRNLNRLAASSTFFDSCYTPCPVCAPARGSFITGKFVNRIGTWDNSTPYDGTVTGLSHWLTGHGIPYYNIGKTHFHHEGYYAFTGEDLSGYMHRPDIGSFFRDQDITRIGAGKRFERIGIKTEESYDDKVLAAALKWLKEHRQDKDWYLYVGFLDPHFPFYVRQEHWDYYSERIRQVPDCLKPPYTSLNGSLKRLQTYFQCARLPEETLLSLLIGYHCAVEELDERIGILLQVLEDLGLSNDTILCYTSDHGEQMGYHGLWWKCTMFEQSSHVPLIVHVPGQKPRRIGAPVSLTDWFPTVCDYMDLSLPPGLDGHSLRPFVESGENSAHADFAFSEYHAHGISHGMFMIRWNQYKYVYYCYDKPQLFDLSRDPGENHSLLETDSASELSCETMAALEECHRRLLSVCNPYIVDQRARQFQNREKLRLGITEYDRDMGDCPVSHPEAY